MPTTTPQQHLRLRLDRALEAYKQDLQGLETALLKFEEALLELEEEAFAEETPKHQRTHALRLLSISEVCEVLGTDRDTVLRRLRSGEIPAFKLGHAIKVRKADLEEHVEHQRHHRSLAQENDFTER